MLYTGSEDGILCGWQLPPSNSLSNGDSSRESTEEADMSEDSEHEQEEEEDDGMNVDEDDEDEMVFAGREGEHAENGKRRAGEVLGGGNSKRRR